MKLFPPSLVRPARLDQVVPPAILLQTGKYGAPFLVVGSEEAAMAIFLAGEYQFRAFEMSTAANWNGLAVENIQLEVDLNSAVDLSMLEGSAGMLVRKDDALKIAAIADGPFRRITEIPIQASLPSGSENQAIGFAHWRAVVSYADEQLLVWEHSIPMEKG